MKLRVLICILATLKIISCNQQKENEEISIVNGEVGKHLDNVFTPFCDSIIADYDIPGLSVGIVKDNEIVYAKGFGYLDIDTKQPVTINSLFHMASISKPFVATAIMQLVEKDQINLDSPVTDYIPYFKLSGGPYNQITVLQMLNHISGMPDVQDYEWDNPVYDEGALERYVTSISNEEMISTPGEQFAYSNMAFECLGDVIAKVSGTPFADYVKLNILEPAGMKQSTFIKPDFLPENWANPHIRFTSLQSWEGYPYNRMHGPSSTLHSSAKEMCKWALINMKKGTHKEGKILDSISYEKLWKPWFEIGKNESIGLSWFLGEYKGESTIGHGGGDTGFNTNLLILPEKSIAVVVLCNLSPAPVGKITHAAIDILLDESPASYKIPAIIPVCHEYESRGLDHATLFWDSLVLNHANEYNFNDQFLSGLVSAIDLDRPKEAERISELYVSILEDENVQGLASAFESYAQEMPENKAIQAAVRILNESIRTPEQE